MRRKAELLHRWIQARLRLEARVERYRNVFKFHVGGLELGASHSCQKASQILWDGTSITLLFYWLLLHQSWKNGYILSLESFEISGNHTLPSFERSRFYCFKRAFYQVAENPEAKEVKYIKAYKSLFSCRVCFSHGITVILRPVNESWRSDFPCSTPHRGSTISLHPGWASVASVFQVMILLCNQQSFICTPHRLLPPPCYLHHSRSCAGWSGPLSCSTETLWTPSVRATALTTWPSGARSRRGECMITWYTPMIGKTMS